MHEIIGAPSRRTFLTTMTGAIAITLLPSPMTEKDYVKAVHFFAEGNPNPLVASFYFTALAPKAAAAIRIRLAQTQNVVAVAEMSSGDLFTSAKEVKVTIGGCGG